MNYKVVFVDRAISDLTEIEEYIALNELLGRVDKIINKIIDACRNLERFLFLGHHPKEILEHNRGYMGDRLQGVSHILRS